MPVAFVRQCSLFLLIAAILVAVGSAVGAPAAHAQDEEASADAETTDAMDGGVVGELPPRLGVSLVMSAGGTVESILEAMAADGCHPRSMFANSPSGSGLVGYYVGAPEALNAAFNEGWPDGLPEGTPLLVTCVLKSQLVAAEWAGNVCLAAQTFADAYAAAWDDKDFDEIRALTVEERIERGGQLVPEWIAAARAAEASLDGISAPEGTARYHASLVDLMGNLAEVWEAAQERLAQAETADDIEKLNLLASQVLHIGEAASLEAGLDLERSTLSALRGITPCGTVQRTLSLTGDIIRVPLPEDASQN